MTALAMLRALQASRPLARRAALAMQRFSTDAPSSDGGGDSAAPLLPQHIKFRMPDLDFEQISGGAGSVTLSKWHVREGDEIKDGAHMCEIDTPDLMFVLDAGDEGYLARILVPEDTKDVPAGQPLAVIVPTEADVAVFRAALQQHPRAIEGYVEPTDADVANKTNDATTINANDVKSTETASASSSSESDAAAAVLRTLSKLHKDGHFADDAVYKVLKSLARKNDAQLLVTYRGSFEGDAFDTAFFVETATELALETTATKTSS